MRIAAVCLSHFVCGVELRRRPDLRGLPLLIGDSDPPKRVLDCSAEAERLGVFAGLPFRQALSRCPSAVQVPPDVPTYQDRWEGVLDSLWRISPEVEDGGIGLSYVNVTGLSPHYGSRESAIAEAIRRLLGSQGATVGIAEGKFAARVAACDPTAGIRIVDPGDEARFVARAPVELLPLAPALVDRLKLLALDEIADVAALPLPALVAQFGKAGPRLWELANGIDTEALRPRQPVPVLEEWLAFDGPVSTVEVLVAAGRQLVSRLNSPLAGRGVRSVSTRAELASGRIWDRRLVLREAVSETDRIAFIVKTMLTETPPPAPALRVGLRFAGLTGESGRQLSLLERRSRDSLGDAIRQLKARFGHSPIYRCLEVEPWSVIPEDRHLLIESDE